MSYKKWTDQELKDAVKISYTISDVLRILGYKSKNSGNHQFILGHISRLNLDISHFFEYKYGKRNTTKRNLEEYLGKDGYPITSNNLKKKLIKHGLLEYKCNTCGLINWNDNYIVLHLDHVNGDNRDNRLDNLRLLCPNCHSQTPTYCRGYHIKSNHVCPICGGSVSRNGKKCVKCSANLRKNRNTKIDWPEYNELLDMVKSNNYVKIGKLLGVSDNAVRKRLKNGALEQPGSSGD